MWFLLRMTFWLGVVLVLLSNVGSQSIPISQINATEALLAAKDLVMDIRQICDRQREACAVGSQTTLTLEQRAQVGAKIVYGFLRDRFGSNGREPEQIRASVPIPRRPPSQDTLRPTDLASPWRPAAGRTHVTRELDN